MPVAGGKQAKSSWFKWMKLHLDAAVGKRDIKAREGEGDHLKQAAEGIGESIYETFAKGVPEARSIF